MPKLEIKLLGDFIALHGRTPIQKFRTSKAKALLAYLAVDATQRHQRERILDLLWPGLPEKSARTNLRQVLYQMRSAIPEVAGRENGALVPLAVSDYQTVQLNPDAEIFVDSAEFEHHLNLVDCHEHNDILHCPTCYNHLTAAARLYQGRFLSNLHITDSNTFEDWVLLKQETFERRYLNALELIASSDLANGRYAQAESLARQQLTYDDLRESAHRQLLESLARNGKRNEALAHYDQLYALFDSSLGVEPSAGTVQLITAITNNELEHPLPTDDQFAPLEKYIDDLSDLQANMPASFVAREDQLQQLNKHLQKTLAGQGQLLFLTGEAGRGKTSLLKKFAQQALATHPELLVLVGSSDVYTGLGDPLLPFRDIFHLLSGDLNNSSMRDFVCQDLANRLNAAAPSTVATLLEHGPNLIGTLVPGTALAMQLANKWQNTDLLKQLQTQINRNEAATSHELQQERLFEEISSTLNALARQRPIVLILDDLHWVDVSTAGLLGHLAARIQSSDILIVGSLRPEDIVSQQSLHPLQSVLSESQRIFGSNRVDLDDLAEADELAFVNALVDLEPNALSSDFRQQLAHITQGNALFAVELLRDMQERGDITRDDAGRWIETSGLSWQHIPVRIESVIEKRMLRLSAESRERLTIASVQGEVFNADVIAQVTQTDLRQLRRQLSVDLDRKQRLIHEHGLQRVGTRRLLQHRFRHQLFQQYLYDQLGSAERIYLHEDVGLALESLYAEQTDPHHLPAAQLARHFEGAERYTKAAHYLLLAGRNAARAFAFEGATIYYKRGLALLADLTDNSERIRLEFELTHALCQAYWGDGRVTESIAFYDRSCDLALKQNDLDLWVLVYEDPRWRFNLRSKTSEAFLQSALARVGDATSSTRVRLLVILARTKLDSGNFDKLRSMVDEAIELAKEIDDPVALCDALRISLQIGRQPENSAERLATAQQMIAIARRIDDNERLADALGLYLYDLLEIGDIDEARRAGKEQGEVAAKIRLPFQVYMDVVFRTMDAILRGAFEEAEELANEAADLSERLGVAQIDGVYGVHLFTIRSQQGRLHEIAPLLKMMAANDQADTTWLPGLALIYASLDERALCRDLFDRLTVDRLTRVPVDSMWTTSLAYLTEVCAYLDDATQADMLYAHLLPYDGRTVVVGAATACFGAVARYLGMLASTMGQHDVAERHFEDALALDAQLDARPWLANTQFQYALMLIRRGDSAETARINHLLSKSLSTAQKLGMAGLIKKVRSLAATQMREGCQVVSPETLIT